MADSHLTLFLVLLAAPLSSQEYQLVELDPLDQLGGDFVVGANAAGDAAGSGIPSGAAFPQPIVFSSAGPQVLAVLPGAVMGEANAISDLGVVGGSSTDVQTSGSLTFFFDTATVWDASGAITDLRAASTGGAALELFRTWDVNNGGVAVGFGRDASISAGRGFIWDAGFVTEIPPLPGVPVTRMTQAYGINQTKQVVGFAEDGGGFDHAILFDAGVLTDLHAGAGVPGRTSVAWDINEAGWVAGAADFVGDFIDWKVAAVWRPDGSVLELGTLGGTVGVTYSINASNEAVGNAATPGGAIRAFLWRDGVMVDLNQPALLDPVAGWTMVEARTIGSNGHVVGLAHDGVGLHPVELVPKPCNGFFQSYGQGCDGSGGFIPQLAGFGCPSADEELLLAVQKGLGGASGFLAIGSGQGVLPLSATCELQVLPLLPALIPITLDGTGPGQGTLELSVDLPPGTLPFDLYLQALFLDLGPTGPISSSPPLHIHGG